MFEKTLPDIVKGIRASKRDTVLYISQCIAEIKTEINSSDMFVKANALQKLTFLQMMGYGMNWASFATIEVMSSPRFAHKRIGYLAAIQGFTQDTDVLLLTTNSLKKELRAASGGSAMRGVYEAGLAVNCVANIVTEELAQDLLPELTNLTQHPQPYLRKKAILCLFKVFVKYPQGLRLTFGKIQQCLGDSNAAVASCAVNVITELSDKNPKNYLHLAPAFFDLLSASSNNWMLIKVVKLLGSLVPEEPRLARKLLEPLSQIVRSTPARSLVYEAVHAITLCLPYCRRNDGSMPGLVPEIVDLCAKTLRDFVEEKDQNLKYLGLVGFSSLMQSHPKVLSAPSYRPIILACLSDEDVTIRTRALGLLPGMASRKNLMELVKQLLQHVKYASGSYKHELVAKIIEMCSGEKYALLQDFTWYLDTLFRLGHMRGLEAHAELLRSQVSDVALRVLPVRAFAVKRSLEILLEGELIENNEEGGNGRGKHIMPEILPSLAWIVGEYSDLFPEAISIDKDAVYIYDNDSQGPYHSFIQAITSPTTAMKLPPSTQQVYVQGAMKVFAAAAGNSDVSDAELEACCSTLSSNLPVFMQSTNVEVQERSFSLHSLLKSLDLLVTTSAKKSHHSTMISANTDSSSEEETEGNLLDMPGSLPSPKKPAGRMGKIEITTSSVGVSSRARSSSNMLDYLLKQSPMKPTSTKVQKKKHSAPVGVSIDINAPVDYSIFATLMEEDKAQRKNGRRSMEAISFTQQSSAHHSSATSDDYRALNSTAQSPLNGALFSDQNVSYDGDRNSETAFGSNTTGKSSSSSNHPFYLNSSPAMLDAEEAPSLPSRFGTIQLGDVDSDEEVAGEKKKKPKHKKKKKHSKNQAQSSLNTSFDTNAFAVYGSDDDEDNNLIGGAMRSSTNGGQRTIGNEFDSLAKVDLTKPLREDEVMPERRHRVVPETAPSAQPFSGPPQLMDEGSTKKSKKKKKKESKKSKKKAKENASTASSSGGVGDLLDLGESNNVGNSYATGLQDSAFGANDSQPTMMAMQAQNNAISSAFDDLLGLNSSDAVPGASLPSSGAGTSNALALPSAAPLSFHGAEQPWIKANIKSSNARGTPIIDWTKVQLRYRSLRGSGGISLTFRVDNQMQSSMLSGLVMQLNGQNAISFGSISPSSSVEAANAFKPMTSEREIKGNLVSGKCEVPVKITLPVAADFTPTLGLRLEDVATELSSAQWSSNSAKVELSASTALEQVVPTLRSFLSLGEVEPESSGPLNRTFAGKSSDGTPVRILVKVKPGTAKVDVKCTNAVLGKAIASDIKRLIL
ncbi:MAG: hypothetical protein SGBAC_000032 [Bacillariaceae sp.]